MQNWLPLAGGIVLAITLLPERARRRYERALGRLREAGIPTREDPQAVAPALGYSIEEVDTAGHGETARAAAAEERLAPAAVDPT